MAVDPISIAATALAIATAIAQLSKTVADFCQGAADIAKLVKDLERELDSLHDVVDSIDKCLRLQAFVKASTEYDRQSGDCILEKLERNLAHCQRSVEQLQVFITEVTPSEKSNFVIRGMKFNKFQNRFADFVRIRQQIQNHKSALHLSFTMIQTCKQMQSDERDKVAIQQMSIKIDMMTQLIQELGKQHQDLECTVRQSETVAPEEIQMLEDIELVRQASIKIKRVATEELQRRISTVGSEGTMQAAYISELGIPLSQERKKEVERWIPVSPVIEEDIEAGEPSSMLTRSASAANPQSVQANLSSSPPLPNSALRSADDMLMQRKNVSRLKDLKTKDSASSLGTKSPTLRDTWELSLSSEEFEDSMMATITAAEQVKQRSDKPFADETFDQISKLLVQGGKQRWSERPRTYLVLRMIGEVQAMDTFVMEGLKDIHFPYTEDRLPKCLSSLGVRHAFIQKQALVLSPKAVDLVGGGKHRHISGSADSSFVLVQSLGKGGQGVIDKIKSKLTLQDYARKRIHRSRAFAKDRAALETFENEVHNLKRLEHRHLVRFVGSYTDKNYVGIIMQPVADTDLKKFLTRDPFPAHDLLKLGHILGCLSSAVEYLHQHNCRHKDIKPANILIHNDTVLITDFGIALDWTERDHDTTIGPPSAYTKAYVAPEVARAQSRNMSSDIWSLGCVFLDILTVMKRKTIEEKNRFFKEEGTGLPNAWQNPLGVEAWIGLLESTCEADNLPLQWARSMLEEDPELRPDATALKEAILASDESSKYCGFCCNEGAHSEDAEEDSWRGSDSEDEAAQPTASYTRSTTKSHRESDLSTNVGSSPLSASIERTEVDDLARFHASTPTGLKSLQRAHGTIKAHNFDMDGSIRAKQADGGDQRSASPRAAGSPGNHQTGSSNSIFDPTRRAVEELDTNFTKQKISPEAGIEGLATLSPKLPGPGPLVPSQNKSASHSYSEETHEQMFVTARAPEPYAASNEAGAQNLGRPQINPQQAEQQQMPDLDRGESYISNANSVAGEMKPVLLPRQPDAPRFSIRGSSDRPSAKTIQSDESVQSRISRLFFSDAWELETVLMDERSHGDGAWRTSFVNAVGSADIESRFNTMLHYACIFDDLGLARDSAELCIQAGAHVNADNFANNTPLHYAVMQGFGVIVQYLLKNGADPSKPNLRKQSPLHIACKQDGVRIVKQLLRAEAAVNAQDDRGRTPLHWACERQSPAIAVALLTGGADRTITDENGRDPFSLCGMQMYKEVLDLARNEGLALVDGERPPPYESLHQSATASSKTLCSCETCMIVRALEDVKDNNGDPVLGCLCICHVGMLSAWMICQQLLIRDLGACECEKCEQVRSTVCTADRVQGCSCARCKGEEEVSEAEGAQLLQGAYQGHQYWDSGIAQALTKPHDYNSAHAKYVAKAVNTLSNAGFKGRRSYRTDPNRAWIWAMDNNADLVDSDDIFELLLDCGARVNTTDSKGRTALHVAAAQNDLPLASLLIKRGANMEAERPAIFAGDAWFTPLKYALFTERCAMMRLLLREGARVDNNGDTNGRTVLHWSVAGYDENPIALPLILAHNPNLGLEDKSHVTPLQLAVLKRSGDATRLLVEAGANLEQATSALPKPLFIAIECKFANIVRLLTTYGANVHTFPGLTGVTGSTCAMMEAARVGNDEVIAALLSDSEAAQDVHFKGARGKTPLHMVAEAPDMNKVVAARLLIQAGANASTEDKMGNTPLHIAARAGSALMVSLLLAADAPHGALNREGKTACDLAIAQRHKEVVEMLGGKLKRRFFGRS